MSTSLREFVARDGRDIVPGRRPVDEVIPLMQGLLWVGGAIMLLLVVGSGLFAAGLPGYQVVAFTAFGGVIGSVLAIAISLAVRDRTQHHHHAD